MQRKVGAFPVANNDLQLLKHQLLQWGNQHDHFLFLDNNNYRLSYNRFECMLAAGIQRSFNGDSAALLDEVAAYNSAVNDWVFGHLSYDFKNALEKRLFSKREDRVGFASAHFFSPQTVCYLAFGEHHLIIESTIDDPSLIYQHIQLSGSQQAGNLPSVKFQSRHTRGAYIEKVHRLREHMAAGDCYELNFCNENFAEIKLDKPIELFRKLNDFSPAPFAACYKLHDKYLISASPERYLWKQGQKIVAQPIKGTAPRGKNKQDDQLLQQQLRDSVKERAENVMIVDLMRNDLSRFCRPGSVEVEELWGVYSFPQVHQLISTVTGVMQQNVSIADALRYTFPMGSMTGAPKVKVMELIEQYELSARGLYSGTVGYFSPDGNFDFNVIIRSLFYNDSAGYLSYQTGGAITYDSIPEQEWDEIRWKAFAMEKILS